MLMSAAYDGREDYMRELVSEVVTTYHPAGEHGSEYKGDAYERQMRDIETKNAQKDAALV